MEKLLDARQVAAILGCSRSLVYHLAERGVLPSYKFSGRRRFAPGEVQRWLEEHRHGAVAAGG